MSNWKKKAQINPSGFIADREGGPIQKDSPFWNSHLPASLILKISNPGKVTDDGRWNKRSKRASVNFRECQCIRCEDSLSKSLGIVQTQLHDNFAHWGPAGVQISLLSSFVSISVLFVMEHKSSKEESVEPDMMFTLQVSTWKGFDLRGLFGYRSRTVDVYWIQYTKNPH